MFSRVLHVKTYTKICVEAMRTAGADVRKVEEVRLRFVFRVRRRQTYNASDRAVC
jgi:hypothetical protein